MAEGRTNPEHRYPRVLFLDGILGLVYREEVESGGKKKLWLILDDWAKRAMGLSETEDIEQEDDAGMISAGRGIWKNTYNSEDLITLTNNPEFPLILGLCSSRGEAKSSATKLRVVLDLQEKLKRLETENTNLRTQLEVAQKNIDDVAKQSIKVQQYKQDIESAVTSAPQERPPIVRQEGEKQ